MKKRLVVLLLTLFLILSCKGAVALEIARPYGIIKFDISDSWIIGALGDAKAFSEKTGYAEDDVNTTLESIGYDIIGMHVSAESDIPYDFEGKEFFMLVRPEEDDGVSMDTMSVDEIRDAVLDDIRETHPNYSDFYIFRREEGHTFYVFEMPFNENGVQVVASTVQPLYWNLITWRFEKAEDYEILKTDIEQLLVSFDVQLKK